MMEKNDFYPYSRIFSPSIQQLNNDDELTNWRIDEFDELTSDKW